MTHRPRPADRPGAGHRHDPFRRSSHGGALVVVLIMLMAILMLGLAAAQGALHGWKTARNDSDRQVAFQAAEAALRDAEMDIEHSPDPVRSRSQIFSRHSAMGFPTAGESVCNGGATSIYLGLCRRPTGRRFPGLASRGFQRR